MSIQTTPTNDYVPLTYQKKQGNVIAEDNINDHEQSSRKIQGNIYKHGENCYQISKTINGKKQYYGSYITYEYAYYVRERLIEENWNLEKLQSIREEYPLWYTKLIELYRYVTPNIDYKSDNKHTGWRITVPSKYATPPLEIIHNYTNLEDALYERDFLEEHEWDYNLLVETIDDNLNPYYDMELPPYPQRKVRNCRPLETHRREMEQMQELILAGETNQMRIAKRLGITEVTVRLWFSKWKSSWTEFKNHVLAGEDPFQYMVEPSKIYKPDLSHRQHKKFNNYVSKTSGSTRSPWRIWKRGVDYGSYYTEEQALEASRLLQECDWDITKLPEIKKSVGWKDLPDRDHIYPSGKYWCIRRKDSNRKMVNYGSYRDYDLAVMVRDCLRCNDWSKEEYSSIRGLCETILTYKKQYTSNMFSGVRI